MSHNPDPLGQLLRSAGLRPPAPDDRARRVEGAVRLEWQDVVQRRVGRRRAGLIAVSCVTTAAIIALVLHAHAVHVPEAVAAPVIVPRTAQTTYAGAHGKSGSYLRANDEDRPADRGVQRHVLASYTTESR